jgi:uncharacterized membrane protein
VRHRHPANQALHDNQTPAGRAVDRFVTFFGSLRFIAYMTVVIIAWVAINAAVVAFRWDPYPFILLNLAFSAQATYAAPLILLSQNRQTEHDRIKAEADYTTNETALAEIKADRELTALVHVLTAEIHRLIVANGALTPEAERMAPKTRAAAKRRTGSKP